VPNDPPFGRARPGAGPRHLDFSPDGTRVYVINELDSTIQVYVFDREQGSLAPVHDVSTLPEGWSGTNSTAQVVAHPNGRFVYGSNRGHDSIAMFAVSQTTKRLTPIGHEPTQGRTPRNFNLDPRGRFLYAANQDTDTVVAFRVDDASGKLTPTGQVVKAGSPSCVIFGGF
jgi:6-phosphogluconolactonase